MFSVVDEGHWLENIKVIRAPFVFWRHYWKGRRKSKAQTLRYTGIPTGRIHLVLVHLCHCFTTFLFTSSKLALWVFWASLAEAFQCHVVEECERERFPYDRDPLILLLQPKLWSAVAGFVRSIWQFFLKFNKLGFTTDVTQRKKAWRDHERKIADAIWWHRIIWYNN